MADFYNTTHETIITGTSSADSILNHGYKVTISTGDGYDYVKNYYNDNYDANNNRISSAEYVSINTGVGNDSVYNFGGTDCTINTGEGNDYIYNYWVFDCTINTGEGDDVINLVSSSGNVIIYNNGDGKDRIRGFNEKETLQISGSSYSTEKIGKDIIVTVGEGNITLQGATSLSAVNINFEEIPVETNSWKLNDTTATYGDLITLKGVKSTDGLSVSGNVVTVSKSALNAKKVTVSDGYTLKLADDVSKSTTKTAWSLSGTKATYKQTTTAGYTLADNVITYNKKSTKTLVTVSGVKSTNGLDINGKVVTVSKSSLNAKKVTISNGYTLKLADDVPKPSTKKAEFTISGKTATYKSSYNTAGYKLASNAKSITYSKATTATNLVTIKGAKATKGLSVSGNVITLKNSAINKKVTVSGGYEFNFASNYSKATITGSKNADTITARGKNISVNGGNGNDLIKILGSGTIKGGNGADIFAYESGQFKIIDYSEEDKISLASGNANVSISGDDVIFNGKITINGGADKNITYIDASGENIYSKIADDYKIDGKTVTILDNYTKESFDITNENSIQTIDASAAQLGLTITGNKLKNKIIGSSEDDTIYGAAGADTIFGDGGNDCLIGGAGNDCLGGGIGDDSLWGGAGTDTLFGGDGSDTFIYQSGDDKVIISDFDDSLDKIRVLSGDVGSPYTNKAGDVMFDVGDGQIVVSGGSDKYIPIYDKGKNLLVQYKPSK